MDEEEFILHPVRSTTINQDYRSYPNFHSAHDEEVEEEENLLEAPPSLLVDTQQAQHQQQQRQQQQQYPYFQQEHLSVASSIYPSNTSYPYPTDSTPSPASPSLPQYHITAPTSTGRAKSRKETQQGRKTHRHGYQQLPKVSTYDRTMWRWANVQNMDDFFQRVYEYYQGKGLYCILLARLLNLLTLAFIIIFSTFLIGCVNYSDITSHHKLEEVIEPQCISNLSATKFLFLLIFIAWWAWQLIRFVIDLPMLREMHNFYTHLLLIPDQDMQTVSWQTVLERIIDIRESNPHVNDIRLTEHDVASRIMRKENYLIALFNKDVLNLTLPIPYLKDRPTFTKDLEWNLSFALLGYVFDHKGQIRKRFLKERNKPFLAAELRRRFMFMGLLNLLLAPFIFAYLLLYFFFRYFEEYHKNPGEIGSRTYTPFAKWKFREFNELPHFFRNRISQSYEHANLYINQFPKEKTVLVARFVAFLSGSIAGVLALFTLFDSEALLNFEISQNGTVLFYLGVTGTLFAVTRGMIPDENQVFEPEKLLRKVVEHTHYLPVDWKHKLHTDEVRGEFCKMFDYKVGIFLQELLSVIVSPLILWISLPKSADQIIDFFREFTVHVNGLGYVCSFAQFDFERHGNTKYGVPGMIVEDAYYLSNQGKMEKSFLNFKANHPKWVPTDPAGSLYLSRLAEFKNQKHQQQYISSNTSTTSSEEVDADRAGVPTKASGKRRMNVNPYVSDNLRKGKENEKEEEEEEEVVKGKRPIQLNQYGIPADIVPSNLGEPFAQGHSWKEQQQQEEEAQKEDDEEEEEEVSGRSGRPHRRGEGMLGLLNQFYDLNNNPTV
ncbi:autophagy protein Apg9-domain-containing protein [Mycotypha africana]|uniref:autophagy protein Apg9-domain-containing protein n=1 Tax=Mycotypha africana TaxID=64632 RepID=UPI0023015E7D|nr:autophagy protein Apg9-domain-containing protein [Mycotypha africana]KAI8977112.1 autophagy protein Apg9-domain-containing protein [Mycotypha africana]